MRIQKIEEIKKSLVEIGDNLLNSYIKVGNQKLFVHKNTLYTGLEHKKIAGHLENGMVVLSRRKPKSKSRRTSTVKMINMSRNTTRSNMNRSNMNRSNVNRSNVSETTMNITPNTNQSNVSEATMNQQTMNITPKSSMNKNKNKSISFETAPEEPMMVDSSEPEKEEPDVEPNRST